MIVDNGTHLIGWPAVEKLTLNKNIQRSSQERGAIIPSL